jgi:hypothetical protein
MTAVRLPCPHPKLRIGRHRDSRYRVLFYRVLTEKSRRYGARIGNSRSVRTGYHEIRALRASKHDAPFVSTNIVHIASLVLG